jgi:hypothetical protein
MAVFRTAAAAWAYRIKSGNSSRTGGAVPDTSAYGTQSTGVESRALVSRNLKKTKLIYLDVGSTAVSSSDTGTGVDAATDKSSTAFDTGTDTETTSLVTALTASDTGTGAESTSLATSLTTADTGAGADTITAKSSTAFDTGTGVDAVTDKSTTVGDTGSGAESTTLTTALTTADTGTGVDFGTVTVPVSAADTGTDTETTALTASMTTADTGAGVEATTLATALTAADTGTGVDAISAKSSTAFDTGTGVDALVTLGLNTADTGAGADAISAKSSTSSDTGTGVDGVTNTGLSGTDTGTWVDSITAKSSTAFDTWVGVESTSLNTGNSFNVSDTGVGVEGITARQITAFDTGTGVDAVGRSATAGDTGTGVDAITAKSAQIQDGASSVSSTRNRMPDYSQWTLSGGAFINSNGELEIPVGSASALSPLIPINQEEIWQFSAEFYGDTQSNYVPFQPDAGRHLESYYYGSDGVTAATNAGGYTANGSAVQFPQDVWSDRAVPGWGYWGGIGVHYMRINVLNSSAYGGGTLLSRNPMLAVGADFYISPFLAYTPGDAITAKSSTAFDTAVGVELVTAKSSTAYDTAAFLDLATATITSTTWVFTTPIGTGDRLDRTKPFHSSTNQLLRFSAPAIVPQCVMIFDSLGTPRVVRTVKPRTGQIADADFVYYGAPTYTISALESQILSDAGYSDALVQQ